MTISEVFRKLIRKPSFATRSTEFDILPSQVCNLSKLPLTGEDNILTMSALRCISETKKGEAWRKTKLIFNNSNISNKKTLADLYNISNTILKKLPANQVFLPWTHFRPSQFYDVFFEVFVNEEYQYKQFLKMHDLVNSIRSHGYRPDLFDTRQKGVTGYFLEKNNKSVFYVVSGNHRVATLSALFPEQKIKISIETLKTAKVRDLAETNLKKGKGMKQSYRFEDAHLWPSVSSGFLTVKDAQQIFNKYYNAAIAVDNTFIQDTCQTILLTNKTTS